MTVFNLGSLIVDHVYRVSRFVQPGETLATERYTRFVGGKGLNQSLALARAGVSVCHAGCIGTDGEMLRQTLVEAGVDVSLLRRVDQPSGSAVVQVDRSGENCILLHTGANDCVDPAMLAEILVAAAPGDWLLMQHETPCVADMISAASEAGLVVALNPAPMVPAIIHYPLHLLDYLVVNEAEGRQLTGEGEPAAVLAALAGRLPKCHTVLTLGAAGAMYCGPEGECRVPANRVDAVDTTGAGDTFIGFFLAARIAGKTVEASLSWACRAAAVCVQKEGAAPSIPYREAVDA